MLDIQDRVREAADSRLSLILGVVGIVFAVALGLQPRGNTTSIAEQSGGITTTMTQAAVLPFWVGALAIAAMVCFGIAGLVAAVAYWPRNFDRPPRPADLRVNYLTHEEALTKLRVVDSMVAAYGKNERIIERKVGAFVWAFTAVAVATGALGVAVIMQVASSTHSWGT